MQILAKSITNLEQIKSRVGLADGIEVALYGKVPTPEMMSLLGNNFGIVNLETNDALQRKPTYRLIDPFSEDNSIKEESRRLIEESFNLFLSLNNKGYFTIHNVSHCRQEKKNYKLPDLSEIQDRRNSFHEYLRSLDNGNGFISLENVYPNTVNHCPYDYGDFGKLFHDYPEDLGVTFDLSHYTITLAMYAEGLKKLMKDNFVELDREIPFLSFMGIREKEIGEQPSIRSLSELVKEKMQDLGDGVKVIHCSNVKMVGDLYEDGFLEGVLDLSDIIKSSKAEQIVPEVVDEDYIMINNQRKIIGYLRSLNP